MKNNINNRKRIAYWANIILRKRNFLSISVGHSENIYNTQLNESKIHLSSDTDNNIATERKQILTEAFC